METTTPALGVIIPKNLILPADRQNEMGFAVDTVAKKLLEQNFKAVLKNELTLRRVEEESSGINH